MSGTYEAHKNFRRLQDGIDYIRNIVLPIYEDACEKLRLATVEYDDVDDCPYKDEFWVYENAQSDGRAILQALEDMEALL